MLIFFLNFLGFGQTKKLQDTWFFYIQNSTWVQLSTTTVPTARHSFIMGLDEINNRVIVTTGQLENGGVSVNDVWELNLNNNTWKDITKTISEYKFG